MREILLEFLCCPRCHTALTSFSSLQDKNGIEEGTLRCGGCSLQFSIVGGIPRFVSQNAGATQERFVYEWMRYPGPLPEDEEIFLEETQLNRSEWKDRLVLDAGCGMGRYSRIAHGLGATVVAVDLGAAVSRLKDVAEKSNRMHLVQGDLLNLPLKKEKFDIVYSLGVIHHTSSPKSCIQELTQRVKPNGKLTVWVYGRAGSYSNFKTNPLKIERQTLKKFLFCVWMLVKLRTFLSDLFRFLTVRLPHQILYLFCYALAALGKIPMIKYLTFSVHPCWRVRLQENFDWLSPPYQSHHTKEEVGAWFKENGLNTLKILPHGFVPKVGLVGEKRLP